LASVIYNLTKRGLIKPPPYVVDTQYEVITGSIAYGVSSDMSDCDVYGFCIPPKNIVFPHLAGEIPGFGSQQQRFDQYQQHHIEDREAKKGYDLSIYNIVRFFHLCMENNPNMVDSLFVPQRCVLHITKIGHMVRNNRKMFLHRGSYHKFRGYAYSQLHKMKTKSPEGKRIELIEKYGFDVKFGSHLIRLLDEAEQILLFGDLDLERSREYQKAIRRGEVPMEEIEKYFYAKEKELETLYHNSTIPHKPDEQKIKNLLLSCLEEFYGNLDSCVRQEVRVEDILYDLKSILDKYNG
jgi:predicted nucleotidyltransferase